MFTKYAHEVACVLKICACVCTPTCMHMHEYVHKVACDIYNFFSRVYTYICMHIVCSTFGQIMAQGKIDVWKGSITVQWYEHDMGIERRQDRAA